MRQLTALACCCLVCCAAAGARAARPAPEEGAEDPFDGALPPRVRVAVEYLLYYFSTACSPVARGEDFFELR